MKAIAFAHHDHASCITTALQQAEAICAERGLKLTPVRKRALEILLHEHRAMGAYELLSVLTKDGHSAQPPVAYRALDFLVTAGFAHKIEGLNAYIACSFPGKEHQPLLLICSDCGAVGEAEIHEIDGHLGKAAQDIGFHIQHSVLETTGTCPNCHESTI